MGKLVLYKAGRAVQSLTCLWQQNKYSTATKPFKATNGTEYSALTGGESGSSTNIMINFGCFRDMTGYVSSDSLDDFDLDDYTVESISGVTSSSSNTANENNGRIYTISATNNNETEAIINSIKFTKTLSVYTNGGYGAATCLLCGYFLDSPVVLEPGETKTIAVNIDCWNY